MHLFQANDHAKRNSLGFWLLLLSPAILFAVLLFGFRLAFSGDDTLLQFYPYSAFLHENLLKGVFPFFTDRMFAGFPLAATMTGGFFNPLHMLVFRFLDVFSGYHFLSVFYYALGIVGMYFFLRNLALPKYASLFGAFAYVGGQFSLAWFAILPNVQILPLLPVLLLSVKYMRRHWWVMALTALMFGWGFVGVAPQMIVLAATLAAAFAIFLDIREVGGLRQAVLGGHFPRTWRLVLAGLIGAAIASPYLLFAQTYNALSNRPFLSYAEYAGDFVWPTALLRYIFPALQLPFIVADAPISIGFLASFFACFGFAHSRSNALVKFFASVAVVSALAAMHYSPVAAVFHFLPVFKLFRGPLRFFFLVDFSLAVLAAYGFAALEQKEDLGRLAAWLHKVLKGAWVVAGIAGIATFIAVWGRSYILRRITEFFDAHLYARTTGLSLDHYHGVIEHRYLDPVLNAFSFAHISFAVPFLSALLGMLLIWKAVQSGTTPVRLAVIATLAIFGTFSTYLAEQPFVSRSAFISPSFASALSARESDPDMYRIFSYRPLASVYNLVAIDHPKERAAQIKLLQDLLTPNTSLYGGFLNFADGADNLVSRDLSHFVALAGSERSTVGNALVTSNMDEKEKLASFLERLPILGRLGVKYIVTATPLLDARLALVFSIESTAYAVPVYLYEYHDALPLVGFASAVEYRSIADAELDAWLLGLSAQSPVVIDCASCSDLSVEASPRDTLQIEQGTDTSIVANVHVEKGRWLVFRDVLLPGWKINIDGMPAIVRKADKVFQAVYIDSGTHRVSMKFSYTIFVPGLHLN